MESGDLEGGNSLRLDLDTLLILTEVCGKSFAEQLEFGSFDTMAPGKIRTGMLIGLYQYSPVWINRINAEFQDSGGIFKMIEINPDERFSIRVREFTTEGMHYLETYFATDPCGKVLRLSRWWSQDEVPLGEQDDKVGSVYSNQGAFTKKLLDKIPPLLRRSSPFVNDVDAARTFLDRFSKTVKERGLSALSPDDLYHPYELDGSNRRQQTTGWGRK